MTEAEWLVCGEPTPMLEFLRGRVSDRKLRLFACSCARRIWSLLADVRSQRAVEVAELLADGSIHSDQLKETRELAQQAMRNEFDQAALAASDTLSDPNHLAYYASISASCAVRLPAWRGRDYASEVEEFALMTHDERNGVLWAIEPKIAWIYELGSQASLFREIVGIPFKPITLNPTWLTSTVVSLASGIYEEKAFDRMPILADALQDAGCDNEDILNHCRQRGEHARGCWVVDLVLGKT